MPMLFDLAIPFSFSSLFFFFGGNPPAVPAFSALFLAITEKADLETIQERWTAIPNRLLLSQQLDPTDTCHPLLAAVHYMREDAVAYFMAQGCDATQPGTVIPYSGKRNDSQNPKAIALSLLRKQKGQKRKKSYILLRKSCLFHLLRACSTVTGRDHSCRR